MGKEIIIDITNSDDLLEKYISTFFRGQALLGEIILIIGWVPIWEMARIELLPDVQGRIKRKILRKLIYHSEIIERIK